MTRKIVSKPAVLPADTHAVLGACHAQGCRKVFLGLFCACDAINRRTGALILVYIYKQVRK